MVFDSLGGLGLVVATGVVIYGILIVVLRVAGQRTLAKLNAFDLVVTVALGSVLATVVVSRDVAWVEAVAAIVVLVTSQVVVAWASVRWRWLRRAVRAEPLVLVRAGRRLDEQMQAHRTTRSDIDQAVRAAGFGSLEQIAAVVLETDGSFSVIPRAQMGDGGIVPSASAGEVDGASSAPNRRS
jgi:uncharacterized membrane protein YcaP (DUF421 family)